MGVLSPPAPSDHCAVQSGLMVSVWLCSSKLWKFAVSLLLKKRIKKWGKNFLWHFRIFIIFKHVFQITDLPRGLGLKFFIFIFFSEKHFMESKVLHTYTSYFCDCWIVAKSLKWILQIDVRQRICTEKAFTGCFPVSALTILVAYFHSFYVVKEFEFTKPNLHHWI